MEILELSPIEMHSSALSINMIIFSELFFFQGETYSFKEAIVLAEYKVDAASAARDGMRRPDKVDYKNLS